MTIFLVIIIVIWLAYGLFKGSGEAALSNPDTPADNRPGRSSSSSLEVRIREDVVTNEGELINVQRVEVRGRFPINRSMPLLMTASLFDVTDPARSVPVFCSVSSMQEPETFAYQDRFSFGNISPGMGSRNWHNPIIVMPDTLSAGRRGMRSLRIVLRLWNADRAPRWALGHPIDAIPVWSHDRILKLNIPNEGHEERRENRLRVQEKTIELAVAVAFADGVMHDEEGNAILNWMKQALAPFEGGDRKRRRNELNLAFKSAYDSAERHALLVPKILADMASITSPQSSEEAVALCLRVLNADVKIAAAEVAMVDMIADALGVKGRRYSMLKDRQIMASPSRIDSGEDFAVLGIGKGWSKDRIRDHLTAEYRKWNSRATALDSPDARRKASEMVELIVEARRSILGE